MVGRGLAEAKRRSLRSGKARRMMAEEEEEEEERAGRERRRLGRRPAGEPKKEQAQMVASPDSWRLWRRQDWPTVHGSDLSFPGPWPPTLQRPFAPQSRPHATLAFPCPGLCPWVWWPNGEAQGLGGEARSVALRGRQAEKPFSSEEPREQLQQTSRPANSSNPPPLRRANARRERRRWVPASALEESPPGAPSPPQT